MKNLISRTFSRTLAHCFTRRVPRHLPLLVLTLLTLAPGVACTKSTSDRDLVYKRPSELVELANTPTGAFGSGSVPKVLWLDPRSDKEFNAGHIPQATGIPFPEIERTHEATCKGYEMFIVYDTDYDDVMSKAASKRLMELGYKNVYSMLGGLKAWKADGYPVEVTKSVE